MARKKTRQANRAPAAAQTQTQPRPADGITARAPAPAPTAAPSTAVAAPQTAARLSAAQGTAPVKQPQPERAWIEVVAIRASRLLGSLQAAVVLLSLFTLAVFLGTLMEHWYTTKVAQELVYKSWWFVLLLAALAVNIFFAAAKKWPFKKHQIGFVITHIGLLTMLFGGILHWSAGTDALVNLIDTDDPQALAKVARVHGRMKQISDRGIYSDVSSIRVYTLSDNPHAGMRRNPQAKEEGPRKVLDRDFEPGPLPWKTEHARARSDMLLSFMSWLANPIGRSWSANLGDNARLEVLDFIPHGRLEIFSATEKNGFPALKILLQSAKADFRDDHWLGLNFAEPQQRSLGGGGFPIVAEIIGRCPPTALQEFLAPPLNELGKRGTLAVCDPASKEVIRIPIDEVPGRTIRVPGFGADVRVVRYFANAYAEDEKALNDIDAAPIEPGVEIELSDGPRKLGTFRILAGGGGYWAHKDTPQHFVPQGGQGKPLFWYHAPDVFQGNTRLIGVLQFVDVPGEGLYYRAINRRDGKPNIDSAGPVRRGAEVPVWKKEMGWRFTLLEHLENARPDERYTPGEVKPGKMPADDDRTVYTPAILCRLSADKEHNDFWLPLQGTREVQTGKRGYKVQFDYKYKELGFSIKLLRAETTFDPGTRAKATFTSWVQIFDKERGLDGERRVITMNEPLEHRGFKFYQSNLEDLKVYDSAEKPVHMSGLTVGYDPGLPFKYLGSLMLGGGIFMMFYMKAYFFKPRGRRAAAKTDPAPQPS